MWTRDELPSVSQVVNTAADLVFCETCSDETPEISWDLLESVWLEECGLSGYSLDSDALRLLEPEFSDWLREQAEQVRGDDAFLRSFCRLPTSVLRRIGCSDLINRFKPKEFEEHGAAVRIVDASLAAFQTQETLLCAFSEGLRAEHADWLPLDQMSRLFRLFKTAAFNAAETAALRKPLSDLKLRNLLHATGYSRVLGF